MKGQKISDRYQIIKTIGEGGMANVYLAYDTILDRNVAVKVLRGDLSNDEKFLRRFQREALSASSLSHPNIVEVYDVGEDNGQYYIVMEYIEGKHLKQLIKKRGQLTISEVIDIMLQISEGMAHAHDSYIIHRDIKPQNIMILENGLVKITDFGIAMALNSTQLTQTNSVMGSVHYLPPEQANGKGSTIKSDIYSMGILMYELLTAKLPYRGDNAVEIALKHLKEPLPSIKNELPNIPQSMENIILKATAKNPDNRYNDAREMYEDLKTAMDDSRIDEPKYIYEHDEGELDLRNVKTTKDEETGEEQIAIQINKGDLKKQNKLLIILGSVFAGLVIITTSLVLLLPKITSKPDIEVPDVSGMSVVEAEKSLKKKGFEVATDIIKIASTDIDEGKIAKTDPEAGRTVKKGTEIILYQSIGNIQLELEDYVGKNYITVKADLEVLNIKVVIEKLEVDNPADYKDGQIIKQSPKAETAVGEGETVTLFIPDIVSTYPDFVKDSWSIIEIEDFASEYNINLTIEKQETTSYHAGEIISQSRTPGSKIVNGASLKIIVAIVAEEDIDPNVEGLLE
ncbi:MAG: Stk1 family PASTA domain-containing Ser/Thr kinase [Bacilli bacterium]|nr:Stk1 family PASTA domain-containing Ser/Thr kinase [Bacilli bacterium]